MTPPGRTSNDTDSDVDLEETSDAYDPDDEGFDEDAEAENDLGADVGEDESLEEVGELEEAAADTEDEPHQDEVAVVPPDAEFDDDGEDLVTAVAGDDEDAQEIEGVRDGEFVCRSCFMAKRETQLADPQRLLCRDCV